MLSRKRTNTEHFKKVLDYLNSFMNLSDEDFNEISSYCEIRHIRKKQRLLDIGETENSLNIVVKGVARKFVLAGKKEVTIQFATEGEFIFSEISFTKRHPSLVIIETIEPCILVSIKYAQVEQLYLNMPKIEKLGRLIVTDMFIKKDRQDFINLDKTIRERFLYYIDTHPHMLQRVPQKYIASYLNIKP
ncbi:MAG: Crp/Fnr family transcriptional regulator, partial [Chitinophagaceae bacterium]|nr:Crp/Fnr family transcriptional regulator [Chitinophagaceae bacterium]